AFDAEAKALDQRLRQLISDYAALFLRYPNVEGRPSVEAYEKMRVLAAIRVHPWRKKLADEASKIERAYFGEGQHVFLQMWIDGVPEILERGDWDVDFAARNLITTLHASLRVRCPGYPATEDRDAFTAATAAVANKIRDTMNDAAAAANDSERCQDSDAIAIGCLALKALGYEGARHLRLLGSPERRPKV
ncbi:MAG: hypothetical protein JRD94_18095, partial [Deltaproteobacteria bacterium]|nr:hypothetical protein [Deltaproteobacteria bacterium]